MVDVAAVESTSNAAAEGNQVVLDAEGVPALVIPGTGWLLSAVMQRLGDDLLLIGNDGSRILVKSYFAVAEAPSLLSPDGTVFDAADVAVRASQIAQPDLPQIPIDSGGAGPAGTIIDGSGRVLVINVDGQQTPLLPGDIVSEGDIIVTSDGGWASIELVNGATAMLDENTRLLIERVMSEPLPGAPSGVFFVIQGGFAFTDNSRGDDGGLSIRTPVATLSLDDGQVIGRAAAEAQINMFALVQNNDGSLGNLVVATANASTVLSTPFQTVQVLSLFRPPVELTGQNANSLIGHFGSQLTRWLGISPNEIDTIPDLADASDSGTEFAFVAELFDSIRSFSLISEAVAAPGEATRFDTTRPLSQREEPVAVVDDFGGVGITRGDVIDGYVAGAIVFGDIDGDFALDLNEQSGSDITDATGNFTLVGARGDLVMLGGTDIASGLDFGGILLAPAGSQTITPLTTLLVGMQQNGQTLEQAQAGLAAALGLDPSIDLTDFDPIAVTLEQGARAAEVIFARGLQVQNTVTQVAVMVSGGSSVTEIQATLAVIRALGARLAAGTFTTADLVNAATIGAVLLEVIADPLLALSAGEQASLNALANQASQVIVAANQEVEEDLGGAETGLELLNKLTEVAIVAQGASADALGDAAAGNRDIADVVNDFTDAALDTRRDEATEFVGDLAGDFDDDGGLDGGDGADSLLGGIGDDIITGNGGDDTLDGGGDDDSILGGIGDDLIRGSSGDDSLFGEAGDDRLFGGAGSDQLSGGAGDDTLSGDSGDDLFVGDAGADEIRGGAGIDTLSYAGSAAVDIDLADGLAEQGGDAQGDRLSGLEVLIGGDQDDRLLGDSLGGSLFGGAGDDTLAGRTGLDRLDAGAGDDHLAWSIGDGNDSLEGGAGTDRLALSGSAGDDTVVAAENDGQLVISSTTDETLAVGGLEQLALSGGGGDDRLTTGDVSGLGLAAVSLFGEAGDDTLSAAGGDETLDGGDGFDTADYRAATGDLTVDLGAGNALGFGADSLAAIEGVLAGTGNDSLVGSDAANLLDGGAGDDSVRGGGGADSLTGGDGLDTADYQGSAAGVTVDLGDGLAEAGGDAEGDVLVGIEAVIGSQQADALTGDDADNSLVGGAGDDTLAGGAGADSLAGGSGTDLADYGGSGAGVSVSLDGGVAAGGDAEGDQLDAIEDLNGSAFSDTLTGADDDNRLDGGDGNDRLAGLGGADTLVGGTGIDTVDYGGSAEAVDVDLLTGGLGGDAAGDVLSEIEAVIGSNGDDRLAGDGGDNLLAGGTGDDTLVGRGGGDDLNGGGGFDTADYRDSANGVAVDLTDPGAQTGGDATGDRLVDIEAVIGSAQGDQLTGDGAANALTGGGGDDSLVGGAGADTLSGGTGVDRADYAASGAAVSVSLADGTAAGGDAEGDQLDSIEVLGGSAFGDTLTGDDSDDRLEGGGGDDLLDGREGADTIAGGDGFDTVDYGASAEAVAVDLLGVNIGGDAAGDVLSEVEAVLGSAGNDVLAGNNSANRLAGNAGDDLLIGRGGGDSLDGDTGFDTADYSGSQAGVVVDLALSGPQSGGDAAGDRLDDIEAVIGSGLDDTLAGDGGDNALDGGAGDDLVAGGAGADTLTGGAGTDTVDYTSSTEAVAVDLTDGAAESGGDAEGDILAGFEAVIAGGGDDLVRTGGEDNLLIGGAGDDSLSGGAGDDSLIGGSGADNLDGEGGRDLVDYSGSQGAVTVDLSDNATQAGGDAAGDVLTGIDDVIASGAADLITGNGGGNLITGGAGADTVSAGAGDDSLTWQSGDGDDSLDGGGDADRLDMATLTESGGQAITLGTDDGVSANVTVTGSATESLRTQAIETVAIATGAGDDTTTVGPLATTSVGLVSVAGGDGRDAMTATTAGIAVLLDGEAGNDTLTGSILNDTLLGGQGTDLLVGGAGADSLDGGGGTDTADYSGSLAPVVVDLTLLTGQTGGDAAGDILINVEALIGSVGADSLIGADTVNRLTGGAGADFLDGGGGGADAADYAGSAAAVVIDLSDGLAETGGDATGDVLVNIEQIFGSDNDDTITANDGGMLLDGAAGDDSLTGGSGDDTLAGGAGADRLDGGGGSNTLSIDGGAVIVNLADGTVSGGDLEGDVIINFVNVLSSFGDDTLIGSNQQNQLDGRGGNDQIAGGNGPDLLIGGNGADSLAGDNGDDTLIGGPGGDSLTGGNGPDQFFYGAPEQGLDLITDFVSGEDSVLLLSQTFGGLTAVDGSNFATVVGVHDNTALFAGGDGSQPALIFITDVDPAVDGGTLIFDPDGNGVDLGFQLAEVNTTLNAGDIDVTTVSPI